MNCEINAFLHIYMRRLQVYRKAGDQLNYVVFNVDWLIVLGGGTPISPVAKINTNYRPIKKIVQERFIKLIIKFDK